MMNMRRLLGFIGIIWAMTACTMSDSSSLRTDQNQNLSTYRSFAWLPKDSSQIQNVLFDNQIIEQTIRENVNKELFSRGLSVNRETPDVLLQYTLVVEQKEEKFINTQTIRDPFLNNNLPPYNAYASAYDSPANLYLYSNPSNYFNSTYYVNQYPYFNNYGYPIPSSYYQSQNIYQTQFKEGTLIIDVIERNTGKLLWRGWNKDVLYDPNSYERILPGEIIEIFKEYPF
jgi:hypothetical protein